MLIISLEINVGDYFNSTTFVLQLMIMCWSEVPVKTWEKTRGLEPTLFPFSLEN